MMRRRWLAALKCGSYTQPILNQGRPLSPVHRPYRKEKEHAFQLGSAKVVWQMLHRVGSDARHITIRPWTLLSQKLCKQMRISRRLIVRTREPILCLTNSAMLSRSSIPSVQICGNTDANLQPWHATRCQCRRRWGCSLHGQSSIAASDIQKSHGRSVWRLWKECRPVDVIRRGRHRKDGIIQGVSVRPCSIESLSRIARPIGYLSNWSSAKVGPLSSGRT